MKWQNQTLKSVGEQKQLYRELKKVDDLHVTLFFIGGDTQR